MRMAIISAKAILIVLSASEALLLRSQSTVKASTTSATLLTLWMLPIPVPSEI